MRRLGATLAPRLRIGDILLLEGPLGAGKTTLMRGLLEALGVTEPVRSPTFNLLHLYSTSPPVAHADLYRLAGWQGIGLEDLADTHVIAIEWPSRAVGFADPDRCWQITIEPVAEGRRVTIRPPA